VRGGCPGAIFLHFFLAAIGWLAAGRTNVWKRVLILPHYERIRSSAFIMAVDVKTIWVAAGYNLFEIPVAKFSQILLPPFPNKKMEVYPKNCGGRLIRHSARR
jgi:hypothetical protein